MIDKKTRDPIIKMESNMLIAEYSYEEDIRRDEIPFHVQCTLIKWTDKLLQKIRGGK